MNEWVPRLADQPRYIASSVVGPPPGATLSKGSLFPVSGVCGWSTIGDEPRSSDDVDGRLSIRESAFLDMAQSENRSQGRSADSTPVSSTIMCPGNDTRPRARIDV